MEKKITATELIRLIPDSLLESLAEKTKVNHQVKKLSGEIMFKLLLLSLADSDRLSLRVIEEIYASESFQLLHQPSHATTKHSSLGDRLATIEPSFFETIFHHLAQSRSPGGFVSSRGRHYDIERFDSTIVGLSATLLKVGMHTGLGDNHQVKFTIGLKNTIPTSAEIFFTQDALSEEVALRKGVLGISHAEQCIVVFDRGVQRRKTFCELDEKKIAFIGRLKQKPSYHIVRTFSEVKDYKTKSLRLEKDVIVYLQDEHCKIIPREFRLVVGSSLTSKNKLYCLTNIQDLTAEEITEIYKRRWDIEVFFRFLKQELNFKHFVSRTENGIRVMLYVTMILSILLLLYKSVNRMSGYKATRIRFCKELEMDIMETIITYCGGDISKLPNFKKRHPD